MRAIGPRVVAAGAGEGAAMFSMLDRSDARYGAGLRAWLANSAGAVVGVVLPAAASIVVGAVVAAALSRGALASGLLVGVGAPNCAATGSGWVRWPLAPAGTTGLRSENFSVVSGRLNAGRTELASVVAARDE